MATNSRGGEGCDTLSLAVFSPFKHLGKRRRPESASQQGFLDFGEALAPPAAPVPDSTPEAAPQPLPPPRPAGPLLRVGILGSGSGGNAVVVESGSHRLLIDAGFSSREIARRMKLLGVDPSGIEALVLTH